MLARRGSAKFSSAVTVLEGHAGHVAAPPLQDRFVGDIGLEMQQHEARRGDVNLGQFDTCAGGAEVADRAIGPQRKLGAVEEPSGRIGGDARLCATLDVGGLKNVHASVIPKEVEKQYQ